jgi:penicillin G amidase
LILQLNQTNMRIIPFLVSLFLTAGLIYVFNKEWSIGGKTIPPLGKFLSPQHGFWQNAEAMDRDFSEEISLPQLKGKATVYLDDRLVPHVFAASDVDAYFIQGYLHAKFRLWQMEFQVYAAAGRISELIGSRALNYDREKRRLGMVYAAEKTVEEIEKNPISKAETDSYTEGVNAYIDNLRESELPVEYKLLNYKPERWSNLKTALFMQYMTLELAGGENDFEYSNAKSIFSREDFDKMYPIAQDSVDPVVPRETLYPQPGVLVKPPAGADSAYFDAHDSARETAAKPDKDNGSNNWAVSGRKTRSGAPILCNDPHLSLSLPSIWFEMQLSTPTLNAYGTSFPGAPGIIIGFNDSCAFGFTNAARDVRDYYEIKFKDETMKEYWYNNQWRLTDFRYERIGIKNQPDWVDTVAYTVFGPVMFDKKFTGGGRTNGGYYAMRWKGLEGSNSIMTFNKLDHAKNYDDYFDAIKWLRTPGQNCIFAAKNGDIAIWDQGEFPAKWKRQGDFVMPGSDSSYQWQAMIPQLENPHQIRPERGFVSSANQLPADPGHYPYYLGGNFPPYRGLLINRYLVQMNDITVDQMMKMQTDNYNIFAEMARPVLLKNIDLLGLSEEEKNYFDVLQNWNLVNDPEEKGPTIFNLTWDSLTKVVWDDELGQTKLRLVYPTASTLLEGILRDSTFKFLDNINTPEKETLSDDVTAAFKKAVKACEVAEAEGRLTWAKFKATRINHLLMQDPFSRMDLPIGGGLNCINAAKEDHGPSWRMVVQLSAKTVAYGIYPGGQSGNPGSIYYDSFVDNWVLGKYYPLWVMTAEEGSDKRVKWKLSFSAP